jgi:hypothetical protein
MPKSERGPGVSEVTEKIRSKGFWDVSIRPRPFEENRVAYQELDEILARNVVRFRGWPVPFIDGRQELLRGDNWIGQDIDASVVSHYEAWRFFTSGQFNHLGSVSADWRTGQEATRMPQGFDSAIEIWEILYHITEVFELAARLALTAAGGEATTIDVQLNALERRALVVGDPRRVPFFDPHYTNVPTLQHTVTLTRDQLIAEPRAHAVTVAREFFLRFGWKPSVEQLADQQRELTERM